METFKKRQKEMKRLEKQRDKAARRMERKLHKGEPEPADAVETAEPSADAAEPGFEEDKTTIEPRVVG